MCLCLNIAGWGQGPGGRQMVPGNGIIVKADTSAASGASVADYALRGYDTSSVTQPSSWTVTDTKVRLALLWLHTFLREFRV
jgi:hypothetical protein